MNENIFLKIIKICFFIAIFSIYPKAYSQTKHISYYDNGNLELVGEFDNDGKPIGEWKSYYDDGTLERIEIFEKNKVFIKSYWKNGNLAEIYSSEDGYITGEYIMYYDNGNLWSTKNYEKGLHKGKQKSYFKNGNISAIEFYKDGNRIGKFRYYHENGKPSIIAIYNRKGDNIKTKWYRDNGYLWKKESFRYRKNGDVFQKFKENHLNGKLEVSGTILNGENVNEWKYYDEQGKLIKIERY